MITGRSLQNRKESFGHPVPAIWRRIGIYVAVVFLAAALSAATGNIVLASPQDSDWTERIRTLVADGRLNEAQGVVNEWMKAYPQDLDARGWHARLLAWTNHWKEAEAEYRDLLRRTPDDVDLLAGLADVLSWQGHHAEALELLDRACTLDPERIDCRLRRARALEQLGRTREAASAYRQVLSKDASSAEAKRALEQLRDSGRHELRLGTDVDILNYAENAAAFGAALRTRWSPRWSSLGSISQYRRFGEPATRGAAEVTLRPGRSNALTVGGAVAHDQGVIPRAEAQFEYGHGFRLSEEGPVRGVEALYQQRWLWYRDARLLVFSPGAILYLPKDWNLLFRFSASRITYTGAGPDWEPSAWTRLTFPLSARVSGHVLFAQGIENFGFVDQIAQFSARTWGGGFRIRLVPGQDVLCYGAYQDRSEGRAQSSFGVSYALRF